MTSQSSFRPLVREAINAVCTILTLPFWGSVMVLGCLGDRHAVFCTSGQWLSLVPGALGVWLRRAYYRMTLERCGVDFSIGFLSWFSNHHSIVGERVYIGAHCILGRAELGDDILLGSCINVLSGRHQHATGDPGRPVNQQGGVFSVTSIGRNVWVGNGAIIMADVGENSVIGAGSVVVRPVSPGATAVGNPARAVTDRSPKPHVAN